MKSHDDALIERAEDSGFGSDPGQTEQRQCTIRVTLCVPVEVEAQVGADALDVEVDARGQFNHRDLARAILRNCHAEHIECGIKAMIDDWTVECDE